MPQSTNYDRPSFYYTAARPLAHDELTSGQKELVKSILRQVVEIYEHHEHHRKKTTNLQHGATRPNSSAPRARDTVRLYQVITICGNRGTGKTSLILTLETLLSSFDNLQTLERLPKWESAPLISSYQDKYQEAFSSLSNYRNLCLPIIFPADMDALHQAALEAIVSKILDVIDKFSELYLLQYPSQAYPKGRSAPSKYAPERELLSERGKHLKSLEKLKEELTREISSGWLFSRGDPVGLRTLADDSITFRDFAEQRMEYVRKSFNRVDRWRNFIDDLLDLLGYDFLVIFLDDTDLIPSTSKDILETIRIYLNHERIIVIFAADCLHLRREIIRVHISQHEWQQCGAVGIKERNILDFVRREVDDYLYKVLPHNGRYDLTFLPSRDCHKLCNENVCRRYKAKGPLHDFINKRLNLPKIKNEHPDCNEWLDENALLAAIGTPAARLLAFRRGKTWCWLGRSQREVTTSIHWLMQELESLYLSSGSYESDSFEMDRRLLQILGSRPAAARVSTLPAFSGHNFERLEMLFKMRRISLDEEMKYSISEKEAPLGVDHEIVYGDNGYFYMTFLIDTLLAHEYGQDKPYPNFPLCRLLNGIDKWIGDPSAERQHPQANYFQELRQQWKGEGLLRGIGDLSVVRGLEAMPACIVYLMDLAHIAAHGAGVAVNCHYRGPDLFKKRKKHLESIFSKLPPLPPKHKEAMEKALQVVCERDDYIDLMLRRINTLICIDKERGDQFKHIINSIREGKIYDPKETLEGAPFSGLPLGIIRIRGQNGEHSRMVLKRCRIVLAWGLVAILDQLAERYGCDDENMNILLNWLSDITKSDMKASSDIEKFIMADIPIIAIKKKLNVFQNSKEKYRTKSTKTKGCPKNLSKGLKEALEGEGYNSLEETLAECTGWTRKRWETLITEAQAAYEQQTRSD